MRDTKARYAVDAWRRPQFHDHPQNVCKEVSWNGDLGHLEGIVMSGWRPLIKGYFAAVRLIVGCGHVFGLSMLVLTPGWP
jgi:hypothetical protein